MSVIEATLKSELGEIGLVIGLGAWARILDDPSAEKRLRHFVLSDRRVFELHGRRLIEQLGQSVGSADSIPHFILEPGEASKSLKTAEQVFDSLAQWAWARDETLVGFGGGVVTDLAAFVSALWKRGTPLILCPTTLEAQIDAAIGGKCGVNHVAGKNLIGTFHHPVKVLIDPDCLTTLPEREYRAGLAESIKHALIADAEFFDWHASHHDAILSRSPQVLATFIHRNINIKWSFVSQDVRETGRSRMLLNFGHTIGHAIESTSHGTLLHGECVAIGMAAASRVSERLGWLSTQDLNRILDLLLRFGLPLDLPQGVDRSAVQKALRQDKKIRNGRLTFVTLQGIGAATLRTDFDVAKLLDVLE